SAFQQDLTPFGFFGLTLRNIFIAEFVVHRVWTREASRPSFLHPRQKLSVRAGPIRLRQGRCCLLSTKNQDRVACTELCPPCCHCSWRGRSPPSRRSMVPSLTGHPVRPLPVPPSW